MHNTTNHLRDIINLATIVNRRISSIFGPMLYLNIVIILLLSILWSVYLYSEFLKVSLKYKNTLKSRYLMSEHRWLHKLKNYYSMKVRNIFLIAICFCECILFSSIVISEILYYAWRMDRDNIPLAINASLYFKNNPFRIDFEFYDSTSYLPLRVFITLFTTSFYALLFLIRNLTQYLVNQYTFYTKMSYFKLNLTMSLVIIITLFICGVVREVILIHFICIMLVVIYEFICICVATKELRTLLKQRLNDAIIHENQGTDIICYYRRANNDYRICSHLLVIAIFLQTIAFSIYCTHPIIVTLFSFPNNWLETILYLPRQDIRDSFHSQHFAVAYNLIISTFEEIILTTGFTLQVLPYLLVTFTRLIRHIKKKIMTDKTNPGVNALLRDLLAENQIAYRRNH